MESSLSQSFNQLKRKFNSGNCNEYDSERNRQQRFDMADPMAVEPLTVTMECPSASVGAIIGKKGANVNEIMNRSGCRIVVDLSDQREGAPKRVNLTGPPDRLAIAMSLVSLIIKDGANALFGVGKNEDFEGPVVSLTSETRCPTVKVGSIIGARGATIAEITRRSGCKVHIIQDPPSDGNVNERQVIYSGTSDQMAEAKALVLIVIADGPTALGLPELKPQENAHKGQQQNLYPLKSAVSALVVEDDVDPEKVGTIIGSKGIIISEIMRKSGCKVIINQDFPLGIPHKVVYSGQVQQIEAARAMVLLVLTKGPTGIVEYTSLGVEEMDILQKHTGKLLGPHGSLIKEIQARFSVKMNILVSESAKGGDENALNKLKITGVVEGVRAAKDYVCHILNGGNLERFAGQGMMGGSGSGSGYQQQQNNQHMVGMQHQRGGGLGGHSGGGGGHHGVHSRTGGHGGVGGGYIGQQQNMHMNHQQQYPPYGKPQNPGSRGPPMGFGGQQQGGGQHSGYNQNQQYPPLKYGQGQTQGQGSNHGYQSRGPPVNQNSHHNKPYHGK